MWLPRPERYPRGRSTLRQHAAALAAALTTHPPASQWKPVSSAEQLVGWTKASTICPQRVLQMCHCGAHSLARAGGRRGQPQPQDLAAG